MQNAEDIPTDFCFDFDEVAHYQIEMSDEAVYALLDVEIDTNNIDIYKDAQHLNEILCEDYPTICTDTTFIDDLINFNFQKQNIVPEQFESLSKALCGKPQPNQIFNICQPIYRDILVFKKDNRINGIAKICFGCQQKYLLRPNATFLSIQASVGYNTLHRIFTENKKLKTK